MVGAGGLVTDLHYWEVVDSHASLLACSWGRAGSVSSG